MKQLNQLSPKSVKGLIALGLIILLLITAYAMNLGGNQGANKTPATKAKKTNSTFVIKELGIKLSVAPVLSDLEYKYVGSSPQATSHYLLFGSKSIDKADPVCKINTASAVAPLGTIIVLSAPAAASDAGIYGDLVANANGHYLYYKVASNNCNKVAGSIIARQLAPLALALRTAKAE